MKKAVKYTLLQKKLYDCLYYFLYSSIKETQLQGLLTRNRLSSNPLRQWCNTLHRTGFDREKYYNEKPFRAHISAKEYAAFLAELYSTWSSMVPKSDLRPKRLPDGKNYKDWLSSGGNGHKYWPVHSLKEKLGKVGNTFFLHGIVHGSICTLDDTDGFSDMDLAFIVRRDVLCDSGGLLELRKVAIEIVAMSYCFDPYMHHGPYYLSEVDLDFYPQGLLPSLLFEYGVTVYTDKKPIYFKPHTAKNFVDSLLENCLKYFSSLSKKEQCVENSWDIEVILGTAMILPALYLQRVTKQSQYKKHTFAPARIDFTEEEWEPIETATEVRNCLPKRYCPSKKMLQWAIRLRWPGLIQRRALNRPNEKKRVKFARERIGPNYPQKVIALIESIQRKIAHKDCEINLKVKKNN